MKREWYRKGEDLLREIRECQPGKGTLAFWYLGQVGFVYKNEVTLYLDPMLNDLTTSEGRSIRHYPSPFEPGEACADYVLCTHGHADHMAIPTIQEIAKADPNTRFIVPGACKKDLVSAGVAPDRIIAAKAGKELSLPGLRILPLAAEHPVYQVDEAGEDTALCYYVEMGGVSFLHMGDTYLSDRLLLELRELPTADLFFVPINGGDYFRTTNNCIGNLSAIEAAALAEILKPDLTIPTHFDMIKGNTEDPFLFARKLLEKVPSAKFHIPALGERFLYMGELSIE